MELFRPTSNADISRSQGHVLAPMTKISPHRPMPDSLSSVSGGRAFFIHMERSRMDASAYLKRQGWKGDGHSLDHTGRGIRKPLLVSKKIDYLGVGLNKHAAVSDQWWMRAFDQGLKNLGSGKESALDNVRKHGVHRGGLYANFVKGEGVPGTIGVTVLGVGPTEEPAVHKTAAKLSTDEEDTSSESSTGSESSPPRASASSNSTPPSLPAERIKIGKRKREAKDESAGEKRSRRKVEQPGVFKQDATQDISPVELRQQKINAGADSFVNEAVKRGFLPPETRGVHRKHGYAGDLFHEEACQAIFRAAGLSETTGKATGQAIGQKHNREKLKRELKRHAKEYLNGYFPRTEEEKVDFATQKARKQAQKEVKEAEKTHSDAERELRRQARLTKRQARLAMKQTITTEDQDTGTTMKAETMAPTATDSAADDFMNGVDEIKLDRNEPDFVEINRTPGIGAADRYSLKAEKATKLRLEATKRATDARISLQTATEQDKIDLYRSHKLQLSLDDYRAKLATGELPLPSFDVASLSTDKLTSYEKRAAEKDMAVEDYMRRRDEKYAAKEGEKIAVALQASTAEPEAQISTAQADNSGLGFCMDTTGDDTLTGQQSLSKTTSTGKPLHLIDPANGSIRYTVIPGERVPLDPSIWKDIAVKTLPKAIREARRQWMAKQREERSAKKAGKTGARAASASGEKKAKKPNKVEAREHFGAKILHASRDSQKSGRCEPVQIDNVQHVPLVRVETMEGRFSEAEMALARTVARRVLRDEKREKKTSEAKGKGHKKHGRAEKA